MDLYQEVTDRLNDTSRNEVKFSLFLFFYSPSPPKGTHPEIINQCVNIMVNVHDKVKK